MAKATASKANWAVEIFRDGAPSEFYAIDALVVRSDHVTIRTTKGDELRFDRDETHKVIIIRTNEK